MHNFNPSTQKVRAEESRVQDHPQVHSKFKASLAFMRPYVKSLSFLYLSVIHHLSTYLLYLPTHLFNHPPSIYLPTYLATLFTCPPTHLCSHLPQHDHLTHYLNFVFLITAVLWKIHKENRVKEKKNGSWSFKGSSYASLKQRKPKRKKKLNVHQSADFEDVLTATST